MTFADVDIAVLSKGDHQRLPQQSLSLGFIPISSVPPDAEPHENLTLRTELHHSAAIRVGNPNIVVSVQGHAVRLLLVTDHLVADLQNQFVFRVELTVADCPRAYAEIPTGC